MLPEKNRLIETTDTVEFIGSGGQIILIEYFSRLFHGAKLLVSRLETFSFIP